MGKIDIERSASHQEWEQRLGKMSGTIHQWRERVKNPVAPEPGSSLAADGMDGLNVEGAAWYLMCVSVEHLDFVFETMERTRTMHPSVYMTIVRTAYISGMNALWILSGSTRLERRQRVLRLRAEDLRGQLTAINGFTTAVEAEDVKDRKLQEIQEQQSELQSLASKLDIAENVRTMRVNQTKVITDSIPAITGEDDGPFADSLRYIWRSGSAAAHGQYHFGASRVGPEDVVSSAGGKSTVRLTGSLEGDVGPAVAGAYLVLQYVFKLYDARRVKYV
ncbi:hypothetical protein [Corynebacterium riegelii]|uniref:hypothetical protein n=1 Tax=Corynebacterium riegelii TaxID=156976 RepID=UPI000C765F60|nr:hypothetical protein [Corynebacterium riegelii]PLA10908.1 hypothetical protein CYJ48_11370 [Corynebacterium riegelii]